MSFVCFTLWAVLFNKIWVCNRTLDFICELYTSFKIIGKWSSSDLMMLRKAEGYSKACILTWHSRNFKRKCMKIISNLKAVLSDILSATAVSLQEMLCAGCQSPHGSQKLLLLNLFQNMSSLGNFSFQFRKAIFKFYLFFFWILWWQCSGWWDEGFLHPINCNRRKKNLPLRFV